VRLDIGVLPGVLLCDACTCVTPADGLTQIYHQYVRPRKEFGRYPRFADEGAEVRSHLGYCCGAPGSRSMHRGGSGCKRARADAPPLPGWDLSRARPAQMLADIRPNEEHAREHLVRNPVSAASQTVPELSEHEARAVRPHLPPPRPPSPGLHAAAPAGEHCGGAVREQGRQPRRGRLAQGGGLHQGGARHPLPQEGAPTAAAPARAAGSCLRGTARPGRGAIARARRWRRARAGLGRALQRERAQVEKDEGYVRAVAALGAVVEDLVRENAALDLYEVYFADAPADAAAGAPSVRTLTVLKDPAPGPRGGPAERGAQCIAWHPDGSRRARARALMVSARRSLDLTTSGAHAAMSRPRRRGLRTLRGARWEPARPRARRPCAAEQGAHKRQVAVAYSVLEFQAQPAGAPGSSFVWDVANPGRPEAELAPASPLVCLAFNLKARRWPRACRRARAPRAAAAAAPRGVAAGTSGILLGTGLAKPGCRRVPERGLPCCACARLSRLSARRARGAGRERGGRRVLQRAVRGVRRAPRRGRRGRQPHRAQPQARARRPLPANASAMRCEPGRDEAGAWRARAGRQHGVSRRGAPRAPGTRCTKWPGCRARPARRP